MILILSIMGGLGVGASAPTGGAITYIMDSADLILEDTDTIIISE
jgi:hypothetical protein